MSGAPSIHAPRLARTVLGVALCSTAWGAPACQKREDTSTSATPSAVAPSVVRPIEHLAPGELIDGDMKAFGLPLPRGLWIVTQMTAQLSGETESPPEDVANYFRARVADGKITVGTTSTQFSRVRARANPARELDIRVELTKNGSRVDVMDVTRPPGPVPTTSAEALKQVGLSPSGRPPKNME